MTPHHILTLQRVLTSGRIPEEIPARPETGPEDNLEPGSERKIMKPKPIQPEHQPPPKIKPSLLKEILKEVSRAIG